MIARVLLAAILSVLPAACAWHQPRCGAGEQRAVSDTLCFGTVRKDGRVSSAEWSDFLETRVTPRFPAGLTREDSYVLTLIHPADPEAEAAVRPIMGEYKARFAQEAVLRVRSAACTSL